MMDLGTRSASEAACSVGAILQKRLSGRRSSTSLGFGAPWIPGGAGGDVLRRLARLTRTTTRAVVATGILNVWMYDARPTSPPGHSTHRADHPGRFLLGLGVSHAPAVERANQQLRCARSARWSTTSTSSTLRRLAVPHGTRWCSPRSGRIAARLSAAAHRGAHPYFVPPEHTAIARAAPRRRPVCFATRADGPCSRPTRQLGSLTSLAYEHRPPILDLPDYHEQPCALWLHRRRPDLPEPTASSTRSSCAVTIRRSPPARPRISTPAPTTRVQVLLADPARVPRTEWRASPPH